MNKMKDENVRIKARLSKIRSRKTAIRTTWFHPQVLDAVSRFEFATQGPFESTTCNHKDVLRAMRHVVRTILENKEEKLSRITCYKVLKKYATCKLEVHRLSVAARHQIATDVSLAKDSQESGGAKLSDEELEHLRGFLVDLDYIHKRQHESYVSALNERNELVRLRASLQAQQKSILLATLDERNAQLLVQEEQLRSKTEEVALLGQKLRSVESDSAHNIPREDRPDVIVFSNTSKREREEKVEKLPSEKDVETDLLDSDSISLGLGLGVDGAASRDQKSKENDDKAESSIKPEKETSGSISLGLNASDSGHLQARTSSSHPVNTSAMPAAKAHEDDSDSISLDEKNSQLLVQEEQLRSNTEEVALLGQKLRSVESDSAHNISRENRPDVIVFSNTLSKGEREKEGEKSPSEKAVETDLLDSDSISLGMGVDDAASREQKSTENDYKAENTIKPEKETSGSISLGLNASDSGHLQARTSSSPPVNTSAMPAVKAHEDDSDSISLGLPGSVAEVEEGSEQNRRQRHSSVRTIEPAVQNEKTSDSSSRRATEGSMSREHENAESNANEDSISLGLHDHDASLVSLGNANEVADNLSQTEGVSEQVAVPMPRRRVTDKFLNSEHDDCVSIGVSLGYVAPDEQDLSEAHDEVDKPPPAIELITEWQRSLTMEPSLLGEENENWHAVLVDKDATIAQLESKVASLSKDLLESELEVSRLRQAEAQLVGEKDATIAKLESEVELLSAERVEAAAAFVPWDNEDDTLKLTEELLRNKESVIAGLQEKEASLLTALRQKEAMLAEYAAEEVSNAALVRERDFRIELLEAEVAAMSAKSEVKTKIPGYASQSSTHVGNDDEANAEFASPISVKDRIGQFEVATSITPGAPRRGQLAEGRSHNLAAHGADLVPLSPSFNVSESSLQFSQSSQGESYPGWLISPQADKSRRIPSPNKKKSGGMDALYAPELTAIAIPVTPSNQEVELERRLKESEAKLAESQQSVVVLVEEVSVLTQKLHQAVNQLEDKKAAYVALETALSESQNHGKTLGRELQQRANELDQAKKKMSMLEAFMVEGSTKSVSQNIHDPEKVRDLERECESLKASVSDLSSQLAIAQSLVSESEQDRRYYKAKLSELMRLSDLRGEGETQQRLYEKSIECAELTSAQETLQQELRVKESKVKMLQQECQMTKQLVEELSTTWDQAASKDENVDRLRRDRDRSMTKAAELSIELAETRMKLDTMTEQLRNASKDGRKRLTLTSFISGGPPRPQSSTVTSVDLDLSNSNGTRPDLDISSSRGGRARMTIAALRSSIAGIDDGANVRDAALIASLTKTVSNLEAENAAYEATVTALRREIERHDAKPSENKNFTVG